MSDAANPPPPVPADEPSIHHKAAKWVGIALAGGFLVNVLFSVALREADPTVGRIASLLAGLLFLSAFPAGIVALCGIRRYGRQRLLVSGLAGIIIPLLFAALAVPAFLKVRDSSRAKFLQNIAREMTQSAPKMIDEITRLDGAAVEPGYRLVINETIISVNAGEVDRDLWKSKAVPPLRAAFAKSTLAPVVKNGATVVYRYYGKDRKLIDELVFEPKDFPK